VLRLGDGTAVAFRPLVSADRSWIAAAVAGLSPESRYRRFLVPLRTLSEAMLIRLVDDVDGTDHVAFVAIINPGEEAKQARVGVARYVRLVAEPAVAEFAITVSDLLQAKGLGKLLARHAASHALGNGITHFAATVGADNEASLRLLRRLGDVSERRYTGPGILELRIALDH
jgi:acetyltransferase